MELTGTWRAHPADDDLRRAFHDEDFDDGPWQPVSVPGHWRTNTALGDVDGPVLYRREFSHPGPSADDRRVWLWLDGVFSQGDVWLDGAYVGDTEGYFVPHGFEVSDVLAQRTDHVLGVEVSCPPVDESEAKRALTGAYQSRDHLAPGANPGGIWKPVRLVETGPIAIRHGRVVCTEASEERAVLALRLVLDTPTARLARIRTLVAGVHHEVGHPLAAGENRVEWTVNVPDPTRWWPHSLGAQVLHDVRVEVRLDDGPDEEGIADEPGALSDARTWRTGFRTIELRDWICRINGERLFLKGANLSPVRADPGAATPTELIRWMRQAREAGLDLVRLHTHVAPPAVYTAADELGMLLWQDMPLHGRYARSVRQQAVRQAREVVDLLGHHPSVAIWCAHDEPFDTRRNTPRRKAIEPGVLPQQLPSWNRTILDRSIKRVLAKQDGSRPVIAHSGVLPHFPRLDGTDAHLWFGWYGGRVNDLASFASTLPRQVRFVSAFGAQAAPDPLPVRAGEPDWDALAALGIDVDTIRRVVPYDPARGPDAWADATRAHQVAVVRFTIETLRRLKYRPTGGFSIHRLADPPGENGFGLLDEHGDPKPAWHALRDACRPLAVIADPLPAALAAGDEVDLAVHVVSDERVDRAQCVVTARLCWRTGERTWRWQGDISADSCTLVGRVKWTAPDSPGPLSLALSFTDPADAGSVPTSGVPTNSYTAEIA